MRRLFEAEWEEWVNDRQGLRARERASKSVGEKRPERLQSERLMYMPASKSLSLLIRIRVWMVSGSVGGRNVGNR